MKWITLAIMLPFIISMKIADALLDLEERHGKA